MTWCGACSFVVPVERPSGCAVSNRFLLSAGQAFQVSGPHVQRCGRTERTTVVARKALKAPLCKQGSTSRRLGLRGREHVLT